MKIGSDGKTLEVDGFLFADGKQFKWFDYHKSKAEALKQKRRLQGMDILIRVKPHSSGGYNVYTRANKGKGR